MLPPTFRTRMCSTVQSTGSCPRGSSCPFAHSEADLLPHIMTKGTLCAVFKVRALRSYSTRTRHASGCCTCLLRAHFIVVLHCAASI